MLGEITGQVRERGLQLVFAALAHLLQQQAWARERLRPHAGRTVRVALEAPAGPFAPPDILAGVDAEGMLGTAPAGARPDATLLLRPSAQALAALLRDGPQGLSAHLRVEGDVMLAATLGELAQHLRWDAEEDLSRVVGDAAAHRIVRMAGQGLASFLDLGRRIESAAAQFLGAPQGPLAAGTQFAALREEAVRLERQFQTLESRAARIARGVGAAVPAGQARASATTAPAALPADNPYMPPPRRG